MDLLRLKRIPRRVLDDLKIVGIAENWKDILVAKLTQDFIPGVRLRNGVVLDAPREVSLNFLFHEIWIDESYAPKGYEIKANETVADIGANIGVFATWAATRAPNVKVIAFEPFPANAEYFRANRAASGLLDIEFHPVAVADSDGPRTLHISDSWILHSLAAKDAVETGVEVHCVSLDHAFAELEKCDFLKLDCEGGEYEILYSASPTTIQKIGRIVCEFNVLDDDMRNGKGLSEFLTNSGFRVDRIQSLDESSGFLCARRI